MRGLGSCVAVILHDVAARIGGVAHVVLPSHTLAKDQSKVTRFADTGIPFLLDQMRRRGANAGAISARLVGGASMFASLMPSSAVSMGERNLMACQAALRKAGVPIVGEAVGEDFGRSFVFDVDDGSVTVRSRGREDLRV